MYETLVLRVAASELRRWDVVLSHPAIPTVTGVAVPSVWGGAAVVTFETGETGTLAGEWTVRRVHPKYTRRRCSSCRAFHLPWCSERFTVDERAQGFADVESFEGVDRAHDR